MANALLIATVAGAYQYNLKMGGNGQISAVVKNAVIEGDLKRMTVFEPRKNLPSMVYFKDLKKDANIQDLKGEWTLLNLWASWCAPCLIELPGLQKLNDVYEGKGFRVVAISLDMADDAMAIDTLVTGKRLGKIARNWDHSGEMLKSVTNGALPVSYIIDPHGRVYSQLNGNANWASPEGLAFIDSLLISSK